MKTPSLLQKSKKASLAIILLLGIVPIASAQSLIEKAFVSMPDEYYLSLSKDTRKEMLAAYQKDTNYQAQNKFKGKSSIIAIDPENDYMAIKNSDQAFIELKLLHGKDSTINIAVNFTACGPLCDSHIGFFASNWQLLKAPLLPSPTILDFLDIDKIKKAGKDPNTIAEQFDIILIQSRFLNHTNNIESELNSDKLMDKEVAERLLPFLKGKKLLFTWKNGIYEKTACY